MSVFVLDQHKQPLMPCSEKRARLLLSHKRAVVHRVVPFTIRLKDRKVEVKVDNGSWQPAAYVPSAILSNPAPVGPYTGGFTARISRVSPDGKRSTVVDRLPSSQTSPALGSLVSGVLAYTPVGGIFFTCRLATFIPLPAVISTTSRRRSPSHCRVV